MILSAASLEDIKKLEEIPPGSLSSLVMRKECVATLKYLSTKTDLMHGSGLYLFQSIFSGKYKNANYLLTLTPPDSPSLPMSIINLFGEYWTRNSKYHARIEAIAYDICKKMDDAGFQRVYNANLKYQDIFDKIRLDATLDKSVAKKIHKV